MSRLLGEQIVPDSRPPLEYDDEGRRLSLMDLLGLAAGGVIGSGWALGAVAADQRAGSSAVYSWLIGGLLMLVVAAVMVELGTAAPKTGGLVFLPLQSCGPLVATVSAAGLWAFYVVNPASEAAAMTSGFSAWRPGLFYPGGSRLTPVGFAWATVFMILITAVNLLGPRLFLRFNALLTAWKVLVPLLVVALLIFARSHPHGQHAVPGHPLAGPAASRGFTAALAAVTGGGVVYAYLGFQGPMDFAGSVKRRGLMTEAARLRWAVYGTICGSIVLYTLLQVVFVRHRAAWATDLTESPYAQFAAAASIGWIVPLIRVNALLSPAGAGMVFTHSLTREVAALSRAHLTHRGLQTVQRAIIRPFGRRLDVYWAILIVDLIAGWLALLFVGGSWSALIAISSYLALVVYAVPGVVLASLRLSVPEQFPRSTGYHRFVAEFGFVSIALILYSAGWSVLWKGMAALLAGCCLLFGLPVVAERDAPLIGRWLRKYDAKAYVSRFRRWRDDPSAQSGVVLLAYLFLLTAATLPNTSAVGAPSAYSFWGGVFVVVMGDLAFRRLVKLSRQYMEKVPPVLPAPVRADERSAKAPAP